MDRISPNSAFERNFWVEKLNLFGFGELAKEIETKCVDEIKEKIKPYAERLLACKHWTLTERLAIMSWIDGKISYTKPRDEEAKR